MSLCLCILGLLAFVEVVRYKHAHTPMTTISLLYSYVESCISLVCEQPNSNLTQIVASIFFLCQDLPSFKSVREKIANADVFLLFLLSALEYFSNCGFFSSTQPTQNPYQSKGQFAIEGQQQTRRRSRNNEKAAWPQQALCCTKNHKRCNSQSTTLSWCVDCVRLILKSPRKVFQYSTRNNWWTKSKIIYKYK